MDCRLKKSSCIVLLFIFLLFVDFIHASKSGKFRRRRFKKRTFRGTNSQQRIGGLRNWQEKRKKAIISCSKPMENKCHDLYERCRFAILTKRSIPKKWSSRNLRRKRFRKARRSRIRAELLKRRRQKKIQVQMTCNKCKKWCW